jgi:UV DNA damage endonuclease
MHYSEPCPSAITGRQRRKHNPRPATLPPCPPDMDLMIEAKDKEQAVFELMKTYRLPGWDHFNHIVPFERDDQNVEVKTKKGQEPVIREVVPDDQIGMGGPLNRVYWPLGMEEWLRPKKRVMKKNVIAGPIIDPAESLENEDEVD